MAIFVGSCRFLESPLPPSSHWKLTRRRRAVPAMASVQGESRRALLLVGISVLPLLHLRAAAANELRGARRMARGRSRGVSLAVREQERDKCVEKSETSKGNLGNQEAEDPKQQKEISVQESNPPEVRKQDIGNLEAQSLEEPGKEIAISGKGVKSLVIFQKPTLYAVVFLSSGDKKKKKKTPVDRTNGENPEWDQPMRVDIDSRDPDIILQFDLKAEAILGDRLVGKARIRVADLDFSGSIQHASYQLRTQDGKPNGVLNFSYWIEAPGLGAAPAAAVQAPVSAPTPVVNYSPPPSSPATGLYPDVSSPPSAPPVPVSASGYYPAADPGYYPPQDSAISYPPPQSGPGYYPPQDSTISYPPPPVSAAAAVYYPPPPAARYYPPPGTHIAAYPPPQESQQIPECCDRSLPQPASGWGYPPPPSGYYPPPGTHITTYPLPQESQQMPECCDRSLLQPTPGWGYPSPAPGVYGYRQDCWDRGLYRYT